MQHASPSDTDRYNWSQDYLSLDTPSDIYTMSTLDTAFNNTYINARGFMMRTFNLTEDQAITAITTVADFGVDQVVDGEHKHADQLNLTVAMVFLAPLLPRPALNPLTEETLLRVVSTSSNEARSTVCLPVTMDLHSSMVCPVRTHDCDQH